MGDANKFLPRIFSPLKIIPEKIATTEYVSCNPRSTAAFPRITPVEPPIVNINKKRSAKNAEAVLRCNNGGFPRYVDNQSMIFAMSCISLLGSLVWGHHMYTVGLETDTRAYFTGVTILISLPTGTKIFNWLSTYLGNPPLLQVKTSSAFFALLFLLMFTIGGSTVVILGNAAVDLALHDTYYVVAHFHFVLSLGAVIAIFSGIIFNGEKIVGSKNLLPSPSSTLSLYHLDLTFVGILLTFSPMHFLGFNVMPRRIPDFPDSFHSWNFLSSIGSGITLLSFAMFSQHVCYQLLV